MRWSRLAALGAALTLAVLAPTGSALAYDNNLYNSAYNKDQSKRCWCVVAVARTWLGYYRPSLSVTQTQINDYITYSDSHNHHDKYDWTSLPRPWFSCSDGSYGHDSRGLAWAMYHWASSDQSIGFNDYVYDPDTDASAQLHANRSIVWTIRAAASPVGVTVGAGWHEALIVGYNSNADPYTNPFTTIYGMYLFDPWKNSGFGDITKEPDQWDWPDYGFAPNSYVEITDWNSRYFLEDALESGPEDDYSNFYKDSYVIVAEKWTNTAPNDNPAASVGEHLIGGQSFAQGPAADEPYLELSASPSLAEAVSEGLEASGLSDGGQLGVDISGYTLGNTLHVDSFSEGFLPYTLVELRVSGQAVAAAMVNETPGGGYRFAGLTPFEPGGSLPTATGISTALARAGVHGHPRIGWAWSDAGNGPFAPFAAVTDSTGRSRYFSPNGHELKLAKSTAN